MIFIFMMVQAMFAPDPPPPRDKVADNDAEQVDDDAGDNQANPDGDDDQGADEQGGDQDTGGDSDSQNDPSTAESGDGTDNQGEAADGDEGIETLIDVQEKYPHRIVTLGSLAPDSRHRMLATFNSINGTVHRLELSSRLPNDKLRYQETDGNFGYLGSLDLEAIPNVLGAKITVVGPGTPASFATPVKAGVSAGLQVGDVILDINETVVNSPEEANLALEQTSPGQEVAVVVQRGEEQLAFSAKLSRRPLLALAPTYNVLEPDEQYQESFMLRVGTIDRGLWRPFECDMTTTDWDTFELSHRINADTSYYKTSLQQGEPPNGEFQAGTLIEVVESDTSAAYVRSDDGKAGWVAIDAISIAADPAVTFIYTLTDEQLATLDRKGPIQVVKRYRMAEVPEEEVDSRLFPAYHLEFELELRNLSNEEQVIAFQLDGPTGATTEGWWFANKIHGRSTALFYSAGARDIVGGSEFQPFRFFGGPEIFSNESKKELEKRYQPLQIFAADRGEEFRKVNFLGVDSQYFNVSFLPQSDDRGQPFVCSSATAISVSPASKGQKKYRKLVEVTFRVTSEPISLQPYSSTSPETAYRLDSRIFAGPKEPKLLKEYGLENVVSYGWFALFSKPLVGLLHIFYSIIGNYGLAIIMLTVLVRGCMIPISRKAVRNAQMMQYLQPEMKRIAEKYKNDFEKRGQSQRELFKRYNYNPMGGCLLVFLQLPIFIGLYRGLSVDIALRDQSLISGVNWCANLAAPDKMFRWDSIPLPFLFSETGWLGPYFNLLPLITIVLFLIQQKLFTPPATDEQMRMTQKMMTYMMIFIGVMFFKVPSGLCIYFITSSLWGIAERKLIPKPKLPENLPPLPNEKDGAKAAPQQEELPADFGKAAEERREQQKLRKKKKKGR